MLVRIKQYGVITLLINPHIQRGGHLSPVFESCFIIYLLSDGLLLFKCELLSGLMRVRVRNNNQEMSTGEAG